MIYSDKIEKAIRQASLLHRGQLRKGDGSVPFITHPFAIALILSKFSDDEDVIVGGILHDIIEETSYSYEELEKDFGEKIRNMVESVTECRKVDAPAKTWQERKETYLGLMGKMSHQALIISAADKIHNLLSMMYDYKIVGESMWNKFSVPSDKRLWFYGECLKILQKRLKSPIVEEYKKVFKMAQELFDDKIF